MNAERVLIKQKLWGEKVAMHLFLVALAAGMYITSSLADLLNYSRSYTQIAKIAAAAVVPLVIIGLIFLFSHLGKANNATRAFRKPDSSWLARGSIALLAFLALDVIQCFLWIWPFTILESLPGLNAVWHVVNSLIALFILLYSGMLLATLKTFPFWRTWSLPFLFAISGLTSGLMFLILLSTIMSSLARNIIIPMASWNSFFLLVLAVALIFFLWRGKAVSSIADSVHIMMGVNRSKFYLGVVTTGIIIPFLFSIYIIYSGASVGTIYIISIFFTILGLVGNYTLKSLVLKSGTSASLKLPKETVPLPDTARLPASQRVHYR